MSGVLRLGNTGAATGRSTIQATATSDATFSLPSAGGTILTTDFDTIGTITWNGSNINITNADLNVDNGTLFVDESTNRVGIGSTSPVANLDVFVNSASDSEVRIRNNTDGLRLLMQADGTSLIRSVFNRGLIFGTGTSTSNSTFKEAFRVDGSQRLLVGTSTARSNFFNGFSSWTPQHQIETAGSSSVGVRSVSFTYGRSNGDAPIFAFAKHRSDSIGGTTAVQSGDGAGVISFQASDGTDFVEAANISATVDSTPGANDMPGRLVFSTTADGASSPTERMRINSNGLVEIDSFNNSSAGISLRTGFSPNVFGGTGIMAADHSGSSRDGLAVYGHDGISFLTLGPTERMRVLPTGGITFNGDTAQANALDDYEEGTFVPNLLLITGSTINQTLTPITSSFRGRYTKIGNRVWVNLYVRYDLSSITATSWTQAVITLPFAQGAFGGQQYAAGSIGYLAQFLAIPTSSDSNHYFPGVYIGSSTNYMYLTINQMNGSEVYLTQTNLTRNASAGIMAMAHYTVESV